MVSDLHLEFGAFRLSVDGADVLIAAGDIGIGEKGLKWLQSLSCPVIYVAGNHEYWGEDILALTTHLENSAMHSNVCFLEKRSVLIKDIRFLGCTLWTDFKQADAFIVEEISYSMNDFRYITKGGRALQPKDLIAVNVESKKWLTEELDKPFAGKTVVVTHHAPLMRSWYADRNDVLQYAYCNELESLMAGHNIDLWVHGHIHESCDYMAHGVRVVCNPRGYYRYLEVDNFKPNKCISL